MCSNDQMKKKKLEEIVCMLHLLFHGVLLFISEDKPITKINYWPSRVVGGGDSGGGRWEIRAFKMTQAQSWKWDSKMGQSASVQHHACSMNFEIFTEGVWNVL